MSDTGRAPDRGTITCASVREQLPLFVSMDHDRDGDADLRTHLRACVVCRRELRRVLDSAHALRDATGPEGVPWGAEAPQTQFFAELERQILGATTGVHGTKPVAVQSIAWRRSIVVAAVMFGLGLGLAALLAPRLDRDPLLDGPPVVAEQSLPGGFDGTRLVGQRTWTGLKGRTLADRMLMIPTGEGGPGPAVVEHVQAASVPDSTVTDR